MTLKHFVRGRPQSGVNIGPSDTSERSLRENGLVPSAQVIRSVDPAAIQAAGTAWSIEHAEGARLATKANELLEGWYPGEQDGPAIADILTGEAVPGGRFTVSIPRSAGALPDWYNRHPSARARAYIEEPATPPFPFGHDPGYTGFDISAPRLARPETARRDGEGVEVDVANTGKRAGAEVVQLYIRDDVSAASRPLPEIKAFERVTPAAGEKRTVRFTLTPDLLALRDIDMAGTVETGTFTIPAGASAASLNAATLRVA